MRKGHLPRVIYHHVYQYTKIRNRGANRGRIWSFGFGKKGLGSIVERNARHCPDRLPYCDLVYLTFGV